MLAKTERAAISAAAALLVAMVACSRNDGSSSAPSTPDKRLCKTAIMSLIDAHGMMSDEDGKVVQLTSQQEAQMKALIQTGLTAGEGVTDSYLAAIHPLLPAEFRYHLLA